MYQMMENEKECEEHKMVEKTMDKIVALAKSRGFVYPGSEIYGGLANTWDYGNLGVELKNNVKKAWWKKFLYDPVGKGDQLFFGTPGGCAGSVLWFLFS